MIKSYYEFVVISDGSLTNEENKTVLDRHKEVITKAGGKVVAEAVWGRRRLGYHIQKKTHGIYHILYLQADGAVIEAAEKQMGYDEQVLKYFVVQVDSVEEAKKEFESLKADPAKNAKLVTDVLGA
ncbi:MAG: 30S ribosomal protein S6 [bacterium]|nr:30S ribosomal protein S6 [bacterium]